MLRQPIKVLKMMKAYIKTLIVLACATLILPGNLAVDTPVAGIGSGGNASAQTTCAIGYADAKATANPAGSSYSASASATVAPFEVFSRGVAGGGQASDLAIGIGFGIASASASSTIGGTTYTASSKCDLSGVSHLFRHWADPSDPGKLVGIDIEIIDLPILDHIPPLLKCSPNPIGNNFDSIIAFSSSTNSLWALGTQSIGGTSASFSIPFSGTITLENALPELEAPDDLVPTDMTLQGQSSHNTCAVFAG